MQLDLNAIAEIVGAELLDARNPQVTGLCPLEDLQVGYLAFANTVSEKVLLRSLTKTLPAAVIISKKITPSAELQALAPLLVVDNPFQAMIKLMPVFYPPYLTERSISEKAEVHQTAKIGKNVCISAFCVVGANVQIGADVILHPHVVLYPGAKIGAGSVLHSGATVRENCEVGENCIVQNGAVIGAEGFGYVPDKEGKLQTVPQVGITKLASTVDVGANACIDRATLGATRVGIGTKIDNLVQIGHNVQIGRHSAICGGSGISGSCTIGNHVVLGGHTGVADHVNITDQVRTGASAVIERSILEKGDYAGQPLMKISKWKRYTIQGEALVDLLKGLPKNS